MVGTIIYVVNVDRTHAKGSTVLWIHLLSYLVGAALFGALLGVLGTALHTGLPRYLQSSHVLLIIGLVCILYGLKELELLNVPAPKVARQVPARWRLLFPPKQLAFLYGFELGMGFTTYVTATTFYVAVLWALLVGNVRLAFLAMLAYGFGRALPMLWLGRQQTSSEQRIKLIEMLPTFRPLVHYANGLALGFVGASLLTTGLLKL